MIVKILFAGTVLYVLYSVLAVIDKTKAIASYEKTTETVPIGDLCYFKVRHYCKQTRLSDWMFDLILIVSRMLRKAERV